MKPWQLSGRLRPFVLGSVMLLAAAGCGGKGLHQVSGQVAYKDESDVSVLAGGLVLFEPADPDMPKVSARGLVQKDGTFTMGTHAEGDGVLPGKYRVMVTPPPFFKGRDREKVAPRLLDDRYRTFATSGLEITVTGPMTDYTVTVDKP
jgi:hypothetical protein